MTIPRIRVLVVEDSLTMRRRLCEVLASHGELEVVGEARDGEQAVALCRDLRPDILTLDMVLPSRDGLSVTEHVMRHFPTPILIVSSSTNRGDLFKTYDALSAGAVDVLEKPTGRELSGEWERRFVAAVRLVSRIKVVSRQRVRRTLTAPASTAPPVQHLGAARQQSCRALAIGASTGGPGAIVQVLSALPTGMNVPIFVLLHLDDPFGTTFAEWLNEQTPHRVQYVRGLEELSSLGGRVIVAPPGRHLVVREGILHLTLDAERHSCRPSIDVLFESLAVEFGPALRACLLTGMGRDGAAGLLKIRRAGGFTVAQDEATCVVYGMPREASNLGAAERVLPLQDIGPALASGPRAGAEYPR